MQKIENEVWERIHNGDISAFEELYDGFAKVMFSLSIEILGDRWEAEEVIQDIFSILWKKPEAYSPAKGKFSSWLLVLTRNRSIDRYRSRKRRLDRGETDEILSSRPDQMDKNHKIGVVDYGTGNLRSVVKAFEFLGSEVTILREPDLEI